MTSPTITPVITPAAIARITTNLGFSAASVAAAAAFANNGLIHETAVPGLWVVRSLTNPLRWYLTSLTWCSCDSHTSRGHCKHQTAILVAALAASIALDANGRTPDATAASDGSGPITGALRCALFGALNRRYGRLSDEDRHDKLSLITGRPVTTFRNLTAAEAQHAVNVLSQLA